MRRTVIVLVVLLLLFLGVDTVARFVAQQAVADRAATALSLTGSPKVSVHGFPFLTQAARGRFDDITVQADTLQTKDSALSLANASAELTGVTVPVRDVLSGDTTTVQVNAMSGTGTLTYAELMQNLQFPQLPGVSEPMIGYANGNAVVSATVLGQQLVIPVTMAVDSGKVSIQVAPDAAAQVPAVFQGLVQTFSSGFTLPPLPYDLTVTGIDPGPNGLQVNVQLPAPITVRP